MLRELEQFQNYWFKRTLLLDTPTFFEKWGNYLHWCWKKWQTKWNYQNPN